MTTTVEILKFFLFEDLTIPFHIICLKACHLFKSVIGFWPKKTLHVTSYLQTYIGQFLIFILKSMSAYIPQDTWYYRYGNWKNWTLNYSIQDARIAMIGHKGNNCNLVRSVDLFPLLNSKQLGFDWLYLTVSIALIVI